MGLGIAEGILALHGGIRLRASAFVESVSEGPALFPFPAVGPPLCHIEGVSTPLIGTGKTQG